MLITRCDPFTNEVTTLDLSVTKEQMKQWSDGKLAQNVFKHLAPEEREFIMTGVTSDSWDKHIETQV